MNLSQWLQISPLVVWKVLHSKRLQSATVRSVTLSFTWKEFITHGLPTTSQKSQFSWIQSPKLKVLWLHSVPRTILCWSPPTWQTSLIWTSLTRSQQSGRHSGVQPLPQRGSKWERELSAPCSRVTWRASPVRGKNSARIRMSQEGAHVVWRPSCSIRTFEAWRRFGLD